MATQRAGIEATVYERYPHAATDVGAFLTFAVNGMDALRAIDADAAVTGMGFPTPTLSFRTHTGKQLGRIALGGTLPDGTRTHTVRRADLYGALQDEAARRGIEVQYGRELVAAQRLSGGTVHAEFADGHTATADMLIGADGIRSTVHALIDPHAPAIEDAVQLARCLRDNPDTATAFDAFERLRRTRVERIVKAASRTSNQKAAGPVGRVLRDAMMPLCLKRMADKTPKSAAFMFDHHVDWDAPVRPVAA